MATKDSPRPVTTLLAALALAAAVPAGAVRAEAPPAERSEASSLTDVLHLTNDQTAKVTTILADTAAAVKAVDGKDAADPKRLARALRAIEDKRDARLGRVLSPVQLGWLKSWEGERLARELTQAMSEALGLASDQSAKVGAINARAFSEMCGIVETMLPIDKERRIREIEAERQSALQAVLSGDQLTKLRQDEVALNNRSRGEVLSARG